MQSLFEVAAGLAASGGEWQRAARLFGLSERHAAETQYRRDPADEAFVASWIARTRSALNDVTHSASTAGVGSADYASEVRTIGLWLSCAIVPT
jgi:hypothetical protein